MDSLCEFEAAAKVFVKRLKQTPSDRGLKKARNVSNRTHNDLLAVPFEKGVGICLMKKNRYEAKLLEHLQSDKTKAMNNTDDSMVLKIEKKSTKNC